MAFNRTLTKNVGTTATTVRTEASATSDIVIGFRITNTYTASIKVSACITNSAVDYNLVGDIADNANSGATIPVGGSLVIVNGDADKVVMKPGDTLKVISSVANSADVIVSVLEN